MVELFLFHIFVEDKHKTHNIMKDVRDILRDAHTEMVRYGKILKDNHHWDVRIQTIEYQDVTYLTHMKRGEIIRIEVL